MNARRGSSSGCIVHGSLTHRPSLRLPLRTELGTRSMRSRTGPPKHPPCRRGPHHRCTGSSELHRTQQVGHRTTVHLWRTPGFRSMGHDSTDLRRRSGPHRPHLDQSFLRQSRRSLRCLSHLRFCRSSRRRFRRSNRRRFRRSSRRRMRGSSRLTRSTLPALRFRRPRRYPLCCRPRGSRKRPSSHTRRAQTRRTRRGAT
jgi:hypothetical protein